MSNGTKPVTEFVTAWIAAESVEVILRVLIGVGAFAISAAVILALVYFGLSLSQNIQILLIVVVSAALFWFVSSRLSKRNSASWRRAAY